MIRWNDYQMKKKGYDCWDIACINFQKLIETTKDRFIMPSKTRIRIMSSNIVLCQQAGYQISEIHQPDWGKLADTATGKELGVEAMPSAKQL